jgi:hypothetical protein
MTLEMSIILRQSGAFPDIARVCPRCDYDNVHVNSNRGWIEWKVSFKTLLDVMNQYFNCSHSCSGLFRIAQSDGKCDRDSEKHRRNVPDDGDEIDGNDEYIGEEDNDKIISPASFVHCLSLLKFLLMN